MGSCVEINDTLQLTREQGFPRELKLERHLGKPYTTRQFRNKTFSFRNKPGVRIYHAPPVRNFLVENRGGKWIYWGLVHVLEVTHDYAKKMTSGKFKIISLYSPDEMRNAYGLVDRRRAKNFLK
jgi:hypothetical protein